MSMVDCVLLLVDSQEGPMPQTRFVTQKAFARGLKPIVIINKVDKPSARCDWVIDQVFDLFDNLGATDEQLDFPVVYASGLRGVAGPSPEELADDMTPLLKRLLISLNHQQLMLMVHSKCRFLHLTITASWCYRCWSYSTWFCKIKHPSDCN